MTLAGEEHDTIMNGGCLTDGGEKKREESHNCSVKKKKKRNEALAHTMLVIIDFIFPWRKEALNQCH